MKLFGLATILTATTMLTACGGGGGGNGGNVPNSTLPNTPSTPSGYSSSSVTNMTTQSFSNSERRSNLYTTAVATNNASSRHSASFRYQPTSVDYSDVNTPDKAYAKVREWLIEGKNLNTVMAFKLRLVLLLIGFRDADLPMDSHLNVWADRNFYNIRNRAQENYDMYGTEHLVYLDNAKMTHVNIEAKQDSYLNLTVDDKGNIVGAHFDVDTESADARTFDAERSGANTFTRTGPGYIFVIRLGAYDDDIYGSDCPICSTEGTELELEFNEKLTEADMPRLKKILIAKLYEAKEEKKWANFSEEQQDAFIEKTIKMINDWTWDQLKTEEQANTDEFANKNLIYFAGSDNETSTITYKSYAKNVGGKGLNYSDFGTTHIDSMEGNEKVNETFVFAGGYDVKKINKEDISGTLDFEGDAAVALIHQKYQDGDDKRLETTTVKEGKANLVFNNGAEDLTARFKDWYTVNVTSAADDPKYNISFSDSDKVNEDVYKFKADGDFSVNDFVGEKDDHSYGAVEIGYYGDNNIPTEATGYVAYGERVRPNEDLNMQIGFGTLKK